VTGAQADHAAADTHEVDTCDMTGVAPDGRPIRRLLRRHHHRGHDIKKKTDAKPSPVNTKNEDRRQAVEPGIIRLGLNFLE